MLESQVDEIRESGLGVADARPGPSPGFRLSGIDFDRPSPGPPVTDKALTDWRDHLVARARRELAGDDPKRIDAEKQEQAGRTDYQAGRDYQAARRRVQLVAAIDQAGADLAEAQAAGEPKAPAVVKVSTRGTVEDAREADIENAKRRDEHFRACEAWRSRISGAEYRARRDRQALVEESDPELGRQLRALRRQLAVNRDRAMTLDTVLGERHEIETIERNLARWRNGILTAGERVRFAKDQLADAVVPGRAERHRAAEDGANEAKRVRLIEEGEKRLAVLKRRTGVHQSAESQQKTLDKDASRLQKDIAELEARQLLPESFGLTA